MMSGRVQLWRLLGHGLRRHAATMFVVTEAEAAAIRAVFEQKGELSAAIELRRLFPGLPTTYRRGLRSDHRRLEAAARAAAAG